MNDDALVSIASLVPLSTLIGLGLGLLHFRALHRTVAQLAGGCGWLRPVGLTLTRFAGTSVVLAVMARLGPLALLGGLLGFLLAREVALRAARRGD